MKQQEYTPLTREEYRAIKKGDVIERMLAFTIPVYLIVQEVTEERILAGWDFDRDTGLEIDEDIQDMTLPLSQRMQISYIKRVLTPDEAKALERPIHDGI